MSTVITGAPTDTPNGATDTTKDVESTTEQSMADKFYAEPAKVEQKAEAPVAPESEKTEVASDTKDDKKDEAPADESKDKTEAEPKDEVAEVKYNLKPTEGSSLGDAQVKEVEAFARENKITPESAQKILERDEQMLQSFVTAQADLQKQQSEQWRNAVIADRTLGGENLKQTAFYSEKAVTMFGGKEMHDILNETGFGNNPTVVKFLRRVGMQMAPDTFEKGGGNPIEKKSVEEQLYGGK